MDVQSISVESENSLYHSFNESGAFKLLPIIVQVLDIPLLRTRTIAVIGSHCCFSILLLNMFCFSEYVAICPHI